MNFEELIDTAIAQVVPISKPEELIDTNRTFVGQMVNKAYHLIEKRALWKFSEAEAVINAVANTRACANVPPDLGIPISVYSTNRDEPLLFHDDRQRHFHENEVGVIHFYGIWAGEFRFYPLPRKNEEFTLRYYKTWTDLVDLTDVPIFPEAFHDLLYDFASGQLALRLPATGERFLTYSRAEPYFNQFEIGLERMANSDLVMKTWDSIPNYDFHENVLGLQEW